MAEKNEDILNVEKHRPPVYGFQHPRNGGMAEIPLSAPLHPIEEEEVPLIKPKERYSVLITYVIREQDLLRVGKSYR